MNKEIIYTDSDELSFDKIFNFISILYKKIFLFTSLLIVGLIMNGIYFLSPTDKKIVTLNLNPVSDSYIIQFRNFNNFNMDGFTAPVNISSNKLMDDFYYQFKNSNVINNYLEKKYNLQSFSGTILEKNILIEQLSQKYSLEKKSDVNNSESYFLELSFESKNVKSDLDSISNLISDVELIVLEKYKQIISQTETMMEVYYNKTLRDLEEFRLTNLNKQDFENESYLGFLKEQAMIARKLNIEVPQLEQTQSAKQSQGLGIIGSIVEDEDYMKYPFYFRGYVAIEKEMDLIQSRENKEIFSKYYADNKIQIQINKEKRGIRDLYLSISGTPLFAGGFHAIDYDFDKTLIVDPSIKILVVFLIFIVSLLISLIIVYASEMYDRYKVT